ncbi:hypothetical protein BB737_16700 [Mycobacterium avium subsp. hominissuis]|uniref:Uncharacterized protein n=2 Tax=Mycobacterium TaxID=1763 RepID=A0AA37V0E7_9MYCO|nr:hypothetical protein [Mycobacterium avium]APA78461.1 hypothetical protein KV38_24810 [Mycobacterium avium subsp. hominissuis]PBJ39120.1 hypothetical protein XV03_03855 [Mycobacterium avium subsp. hominissuis]PBJ64718.1 hypothetical protein BB737_16700 [Mycobacterium avium subsp. hominissuis]GLB85728.1 hypothetical protein SRL2020028_49840 [Mycobacterium kiyosense]
MTSPLDPTGGWVARSFTRARVLGTYLARIPLGDKSFDLPAVFNRAQLLAAAVGSLAALAAWAVGSMLGIASWLTWPVIVLTVVVIIAIKFAPVPERGAALFVGGYARMIFSGLPFASTHESSVPQDRRRHRPMAASMQMVFHPAPSTRKDA